MVRETVGTAAVQHPFNSTPPHSVPLRWDPTASHPHIPLRHQCIARIRKQHQQVLGPHVQSVVGQARYYHHDRRRHDRHHHPLLLVDPAYHQNVGDHMITLGELAFLRRSIGDLVRPASMTDHTTTTTTTTTTKEEDTRLTHWLDQCHYVQARNFVISCDDFLSSHQPNQTTKQTNEPYLAVWHGGGNWGDLWRIAQVKRIESLQHLLANNYTVLGMPQSYHYDQKLTEHRDFYEMQKQILLGLGWWNRSSEHMAELAAEVDQHMRAIAATRHDRKLPLLSAFDDGPIWNQTRARLIFTWREAESFQTAKRMYPYATNLLVPDIAFQLGPYQAQPPTRNSRMLQDDILLFLRADLESTLSQQRDKRSIRRMLDQDVPGDTDTITFRIVDWPDRLGLFDSPDIYFTDTSIRLMSLGRVVICDRLHAAILCYITGIPFIFIDQATGKISKAFRVAFGMAGGDCSNGSAAMWAHAQNLTHALTLAVGFLEQYQLGSTEKHLAMLRQRKNGPA